MEDQRLVDFCDISEVLVLYLSPIFRQSFDALMAPILGMRASSLVPAEREKKRKINKIMSKLIQIIPFRKFYVMRILKYLLKKHRGNVFFLQTKQTLRNIKNIPLGNYLCSEKRSRKLRLSLLDIIGL